MKRKDPQPLKSNFSLYLSIGCTRTFLYWCGWYFVQIHSALPAHGRAAMLNMRSSSPQRGQVLWAGRATASYRVDASHDGSVCSCAVPGKARWIWLQYRAYFASRQQKAMHCVGGDCILLYHRHPTRPPGVFGLQLWQWPPLFCRLASKPNTLLWLDNWSMG